MIDRLISSTGIEPVTVTQLAVNLRLIVDESVIYAGPEALFLENLIVAGRQAAEDYTQRLFSAQARQAVLGEWGQNLHLCPPSHFAAKFTPSIVSIEYYDVNNALQTLPAADYEIIPQDQSPLIVFNDMTALPELWSHPQGILINYTMGPALESEIPQKVKQAIILIASYWYEHREAGAFSSSGGIKEIPLGFRSLLDWNHRLDSFA